MLMLPLLLPCTTTDEELGAHAGAGSSLHAAAASVAVGLHGGRRSQTGWLWAGWMRRSAAVSSGVRRLSAQLSLLALALSAASKHSVSELAIRRVSGTGWLRCGRRCSCADFNGSATVEWRRQRRGATIGDDQCNGTAHTQIAQMQIQMQMHTDVQTTAVIYAFRDGEKACIWILF